MNTNEFERKLNKFTQLLKKERGFLIKGKAEKLEELVAQKEEFVPLFNAYEGEITDKMRQLILQIQQQQEENLLLTQQAMSFQTTLMDAVKDTMKQTTHSNTYVNPANGVQNQTATTLVDTEF